MIDHEGNIVERMVGAQSTEKLLEWAKSVKHND